MKRQTEEILKERLDPNQFVKLAAIKNSSVHEFIARYIVILNPDSVFVGSDDPKYISYVRNRAIEAGVERTLRIKGHTYHFD